MSMGENSQSKWPQVFRGSRGSPIWGTGRCSIIEQDEQVKGYLFFFFFFDEEERNGVNLSHFLVN